jgi:hypothetical protein
LVFLVSGVAPQCPDRVRNKAKVNFVRIEVNDESQAFEEFMFVFRDSANSAFKVS